MSDVEGAEKGVAIPHLEERMLSLDVSPALDVKAHEVVGSVAAGGG